MFPEQENLPALGSNKRFWVLEDTKVRQKWNADGLSKACESVVQMSTLFETV